MQSRFGASVLAKPGLQQGVNPSIGLMPEVQAGGRSNLTGQARVQES